MADLTDSPSNVRQTIAPFLHRRWAVIPVKDNGIGIPTTDLPHIFDLFYRVDTVRSRQIDGFRLELTTPIASLARLVEKLSQVLPYGTRERAS